MTQQQTLFPQEPVERDPNKVQLTLEGVGTNIVGFTQYVWAKYVTGFNPKNHCAACLIGDFSRHIKKDLMTDRLITMDKSRSWDFIYICGVSTSGWKNNYHLVLKRAPGQNNEIFAPTQFRQTFHVTGPVIQIPITPLAKDWNGLDWHFTTCRNFQFGVENYPAAIKRWPTLNL